MSLLPVQAKSASSSGSSTTVATFGSNITTGNAIIAIVTASFWDASHLITAPTGGNGGTWTLLAAAENLGNSRACEIWISLSSLGLTSAITAHHNSYGDHGLWILEVSGVPILGTVVDGTPAVMFGRSSVLNPGTTTPSGATDVILISGASYQSNVTSVPASFTVIDATINGIGSAAYRVVTGPSGAYGGTFLGNDNYGQWDAALVAIKSAGGGGPTTYFQSVDGSITPPGALLKRTNRALGGSITPSGTIIKLFKRLLTGSITPSGSLIYTVLRSLSGSITPSGTLSAFALKAKALTGSITPSGNLNKITFRSLIGSVTPVGDLIKKTIRSLTGGLSFVGILTVPSVFFKILIGSVGFVGTLAKTTQRSLSGSISFTGILTSVKNPIIVVSAVINSWWQKRHRRQ